MKEENVWGRKLEEMIHVHVEVEKNINCVGINKMSEEEIQALYLEQFELTKGLNEANKCHKILDIGKRIIDINKIVYVPQEHM